jgi:hypothetical protein
MPTDLRSWDEMIHRPACIVVELFRLQKISFKKARESLEMLSKIGRYSPEIIADALISLMEEKDGKADNHKDT